ncbi:MAG: hypothetical protein WCX83_03130 [Candidatus Cloacimonas sp.]|nr:hypothetical protein [Candidatus Cloacimonadota bacterium]
MGQQQILLIVLSVILVGVSVSVGISMFKSYALTANQDAIVYDIMNIASTAYQYRLKPSTLGGGNGSFNNFTLPSHSSENSNAKYNVRILQDGKAIEIIGTSNSYDSATITAYYDLNLNLINDLSNVEGMEFGKGPSSSSTGYIMEGWEKK